MRTLLYLLFTFSLSLWLPRLSQARHQPTSYCKCVCFQNSTIIPLNSSPPPQSSPSSSLAKLSLRDDHEDGSSQDVGQPNEPSAHAQHRDLTCNDCNRAFCLDYNLPICKDAKEEDVFATCFQRDSLKDETVIVLFICATASLLGWALLKPWVEKLRNTDTVQRYTPVGADATSSSTRRPLPRAGFGRHRGSQSSISRQGGLNS